MSKSCFKNKTKISPVCRLLNMPRVLYVMQTGSNLALWEKVVESVFRFSVIYNNKSTISSIIHLFFCA